MGRRSEQRIPGHSKEAAVDLIDELVAGVAPDRADLMRALHVVIRAAAPQLEVVRADLSATKPAIGYGPFRYRYASGREGVTNIITLANQAQHVSVYVNCVNETGYVAEQYAASLGTKVTVGKSCIRIKKLADVDLDVLAEVVRDARTLGGASAVAD
jgi:hypothetical protein